LAALGVVYGDLGTNILFAIRECFKPKPDGLTPTPDHVLSVLSLVFWALTLVVVLKYLSVVLRADNRGEGGILALLALLLRHEKDRPNEPTGKFSRRAVLTMLGIFGSALLLADGMITPSISVLSAVEGLAVAAPGTEKLVVPLTVLILIGLFMVQRWGTARIANFFGPVMLVWFAMIALMGLRWIVQEPRVLAAFDPLHAVTLYLHQPRQAFFLLGAIVLCITGAEALYADLGHFGRRPIRLAWYTVAFPALILNYFGQGAFILARHGEIYERTAHGHEQTSHIFFAMVSDGSPPLIYSVLLIATLATVIASQALISGSFSLAQQAVQLGYSPRLNIVHTSGAMVGQIYVPVVNWTLMIGCILLVVEFEKSSNLAAAYGLAVIGTMVITSILVFEVMRTTWGWSLAAALAMFVLFLAVDLPFFFSNLSKVFTGGWVPLVMAGGLFTLMTTWQRGWLLLADPMNTQSFPFPLKVFVKQIAETKPSRDEETAVFMTSAADMVPVTLVRLLERTHVLPKRLVLFTIHTMRVPIVEDDDAIEIREYPDGCYGVTAKLGFMEPPRMPHFLELCARKGLDLDIHKVFFYLSRVTIETTGQTKLARWRKILFAMMYHNAQSGASYYHLPPDRVVELGRLVNL